MNTWQRTLAVCLWAGLIGAAADSSLVAQDKAALSSAPTVPAMLVDPDGTIHFGPRTLPAPALSSPESKKAYAARMSRANRGGSTEMSAEQRGATAGNTTADNIRAERESALKRFDVKVEEAQIGGINCSVFTPKEIPERNKNKVALEFEVASTAIAVASFGHLKTISVHYRGGGPSAAGNEDIVAVYKELLKTHSPKQIGMFGTSGGGTLAHTTVVWLPHLDLPLPGAVGLLTCSGGSNPGDSRFTNNGLDPLLSTAITGRAAFGGGNRQVASNAPVTATEPPRNTLTVEVPKGYPPTFLLCGTRDMCLSQTVLLHRKLRNAGVEADLNVFEGMWHAFFGNLELPESREAMANLAQFFETHLSN